MIMIINMMIMELMFEVPVFFFFFGKFEVPVYDYGSAICFLFIFPFVVFSFYKYLFFSSL